ncbi:SusD/RagB family nutrient-binding outer membrane lipoprotein, partial [Petrimonas mucosa]
MKKNNILLAFLAVILFFGACSDFEEINKDPNAANEDDIKVQYIINKAITDAQQDPHIAERAFVLYWRRAGRQDRSSGINLGTYNNDWSSDYYSYVSGWMKSATQAVDLADKQLEKDNFAVEYDRQMTKNLKEVARIWRVYLMSEFADNFGPLPIEAFKGKNPEFASVKDVYYFMLDELKDATQNIDPSLQVQDIDKKFDRAYQFDFTKWTKYANSMRMRLAMRLSEVDPEKAKSEFEDAAKGSLILTENDMFAVQERDGWDPLAGVMSRPWNALLMSNTLNNLMINLGGVKSEDMLDASYAA